MKCPECNENLMIAKSEFKSEEGSSDVYQELTMVCVNSRIDPVKRTFICSNYAGTDLSNPKKIVEVKRNKVN